VVSSAAMTKARKKRLMPCQMVVIVALKIISKVVLSWGSSAQVDVDRVVIRWRALEVRSLELGSRFGEVLRTRLLRFVACC